MVDVHALARDVVNAVLVRAFDPRTETVTREAIEDRRSEIERLVGCTIAERYARTGERERLMNGIALAIGAHVEQWNEYPDGAEMLSILSRLGWTGVCHQTTQGGTKP